MTSALALHRSPPQPIIIAIPTEFCSIPLRALACAAALIACSSTSGQASTVGAVRLDTGSTGLSIVARKQDVDPSAADALAEIKRRSGLTWTQLATIFEVSRQAVHSWANGASVGRAAHIGRVKQLLERVRAFGELPAFKVRDVLLGSAAEPLKCQQVSTNEPPILVSDSTPFAHQFELRPGKTKIKRG